MSDTNVKTIEPVRKTIVVRAEPDRAFRRFTAKIGAWWPLEHHSLGKDQAETCVLESRVGGRFLERDRAGEEVVWGHVSAWDPPNSLAFSFHPGRPAEHATKVSVTFAEDATGTTLVALVHDGWEVMGDDGETLRQRYDEGWGFVFSQCFGDYANRT